MATSLPLGGHHADVSPGEDIGSGRGLAPKKNSSEVGLAWLFRGLFVALFCLETQCLGLFVVFSWFFRGFFVAPVLGKFYAYSPWNSLLKQTGFVPGTNLRADFREGDEDSNFSIFRVRRFSEWPGPLH